MIDLVGRGDLDGDGFEDLLLFVANFSTEGSYRSYEVAMLTRLEERGPLTVRLLPEDGAGRRFRRNK